MANRKNFLTVQEAIEYFNTLSDSDDSIDSVIDICQLPPDESGDITDEEDINENEFEKVIPADVCGQVEVFTHTSQHVPDGETTVSDDETIVPSTSKSQPNLKRKRMSSKKEITKSNWERNAAFKKILDTVSNEKLCESFPEITSLSPVEIFHKFLPIEYLAHLSKMTRLYAMKKGEKLEVDEKDIGQFFGLLLFSGYHIVPGEDLYWSTAEDLSVPFVASVMSRARFRKLKKYFHIIDSNDLKAGDKLGKISPFYEELENNVRQLGFFHAKLSIDESMVPYYGHHSAKMFIKGKPIRFGFKVWMLCSSNGYPYAMKIYSGKSSGNSNIPLGSRVVLELLSHIENPQKCEIFFDNFFTSYKLMADLTEKGFKATGTIRDSRTGQCPLKSPKEMSKCKRGEFDFRCDGNVYVCRWNDSSVVTIASNYETHEPVNKAKRFSRQERKKIDVTQPHLIKSYNEGMGGVDLLDRLLGSYRPMLRSKKWYWNLFSNGLNMAVVAAWILHTELHKNTSYELSHLNFRREVTLSLLRMKPKIHFFPGPRAQQVPSSRQSDTHYLIPSTQGRCIECQKNTRKMCFECEKRLHEHCFPSYHGQ